MYAAGAAGYGVCLEFRCGWGGYKNVIAVEVHQKDLSSSDIRFDLEIAARSSTAQQDIAGSDITPAMFIESFKAFEIPELIQIEFWNRRAQQLATSGDLAQAAVALAEVDTGSASDETDPRRLRLRALIATKETNHAEADQDDMDITLTALAAAGCTYVMGVPGADDVMLGYQSTSFHDTLYVREVFGFGVLGLIVADSLFARYEDHPGRTHARQIHGIVTGTGGNAHIR